MSGPGKDLRPFGAYHFTVEIDGESITYPFRSVSGLKTESAVVELEEGGFNTTTRKLIGRTKFPNIVLKRGFCGANTELYKLRMHFLNDLPSPPKKDKQGATSDGSGVDNHALPKRPQRISGVITQKGPDGSCAKWRFVGGFVCKWEGPEFDASKNEISIESIEIAHEGLSMLGDTKEQGAK
jgi:phage tail-like protein